MVTTLIVAAAFAQTSPGVLELRQKAAVLLPDHMITSHVSYSSSGAIAVDGGARVIAWVSDSATELTPIPIPTVEVAGVALTPDGEADIVDASTGRVLRFSRAGRPMGGELLLPVDSGRIVAAEKSNSGWWYIVHQNFGTFVKCAATADRLHRVDTRGGAVLGVGSEAALVVGTDAPFPLWLFEPTTCARTRHAGALAIDLPRRNAAGLEAIWRVAAAVVVGRTPILTLADVRSDARVVVILSSDGDVLRTSTFNYPFVLAASHHDHIMAVSRLDRPELLFYSTTFHVSDHGRK